MATKKAAAKKGGKKPVAYVDAPYKPAAKKGGKKPVDYVDADYKPATKKGGKAKPVAYVDAKPSKKK
jgi:hypothetical protein